MPLHASGDASAASRTAVAEVDLSCSESGDDLANSCNSPGWRSCSDVSDGTAHREPSPPISMEQLLFSGGEEHGGCIEAMLEQETCTQVPPDYLSLQPHIGPGHRHFLVSWMITAAAYLNFGTFTSALAVNLLDRFIAGHRASDGELWTLQLAAVACMSIAVKVEEGALPLNLGHLQVAAPWERPFEAGHIKSMELVVLASLDWRIVALTPASFLDRFLAALAAAGHLRGGPGLLQRLRCRTSSLVARTLPDERYLGFRPSSLAAAAIVVAMRALCDGDAVHTAAAFLKQFTNQVDECQAALVEDFGQGSSTSSPSSTGARNGKGAHAAGSASRNNPTPTSVLQLEETLSQLPPLHSMW